MKKILFEEIKYAAQNYKNMLSIGQKLETYLEDLSCPLYSATITNANGGHMAYNHLFVDFQDEHLFIKEYDPKKFTDSTREKHSLLYLRKEQLYFDHLRNTGFTSIPERTEFIDNKMLVMDSLKVENGWKWRIPNNKGEANRYIVEILDSLDKLNKQPFPDTSYQKDINPTFQTLWDEGWNNISDDKVEAIKNKINSFRGDFHSDSLADLDEMNNHIQEFRNNASSIQKPNEFVLSHNDARQSNIAWHPKHGVKLIDWSWADPMPKNTDTTMFLIDLVKSGHDVSPYIETYFDKDHALILIGFWLAHSLWQTHDGSNTVRVQQVASALAAYKLLKI